MISSADTRGRILVVDDEASARIAIAERLRLEHYEVELAADAFKALGKIPAFRPHLIITDMLMPGMDGIELLRKVKASPRPCPVIIVTAFSGIDSAVRAMREGAIDYLEKPVDLDALFAAIEAALDYERLLAAERHIKRREGAELCHPEMVGDSPQMQGVYTLIDQVAPSVATVLIAGETGTGKELVAAAIHRRSPRSDGPFVKLHCAALAETLLESELFGHERGAFTGAVARRDGRFTLADQGTLFLDEVGEISPALQVKLLRFLQEHEFERVGGERTLKVDVRVIAASNRDLAAEVRAGRFREDLFYRLNVVGIEVPALRHRPEDIPLLASHFLVKFARQNDKRIEGLSPDAARAIVGHRWPGNVRELENAIERAVVLASTSTISVEQLPPTVRSTSGAEFPRIPGASMDELERYAILATLEATGGSTSRAAEILGISVRKIQYRMHEYGRAPKSDVAPFVPE